MKMLSGVLALVLLLGTVHVVWAQADPAKEVADIRAKQGAAAPKARSMASWHPWLTTWYSPQPVPDSG
jgi:hypothetical protein